MKHDIIPHAHAKAFSKHKLLKLIDRQTNPPHLCPRVTFKKQCLKCEGAML